MLEEIFNHYEVIESDNIEKDNSDSIIEKVLVSKRIEGCSEKTLQYCRNTIDAMDVAVDKDVQRIKTEDYRLWR